VFLRSKTSKEVYIRDVEQIQAEIAAGDYYEINYCTEVIAKNSELNPIATFFRLNQSSQSPFSTLLKFKEKYCLCASPERFLAKRGNKIISQPIKGTIPRGVDEMEDNKQKEILFSSPKERAENVMIVDLVRNDLTLFATTGSVEVEELFGIYTFNTLHQMISSIVANLANEDDFLNAMNNAYPMGSMTGAPKLATMKKIAQLEKTARGLFSGSMGYIDNDGNADFNVVIRALFYDKKSKTASIKTGSAITYDAVPSAEYEELMLKRKAVLAAANGRVAQKR
jgi:para-aminobenzoate synthetase component 1